MSIFDDGQGNLTIYQGDTGTININGLNPEKNYFVYFAIQDDKRNRIGEEIKVTSNNRDSVSIFLDAGLTNKLEVNKGEENKVYYYGIKLCEIGGGNEDTVFIGDKTYGEQNTITVYPKQVEGTINV